MRVTEIIRDILDVIDSIEKGSTDNACNDTGYTEKDIKRFKQIVDLAHAEKMPYGNQPTERYADIDSVTVDAGSDSWQGTKDPADIRGEHPSLYPGTVHGAR